MIDIKTILDDYEIYYKNDVSGWINIECPICHHSGSRGFKGGFNLSNNYYTCWNCGWHPIEEVFEKLLSHINKKEIKNILFQYSIDGEIHNKLNKKINHPNSITLPEKTLYELGYKYLQKRKFNPEFIIKKYGVCGGSITGDWSYRIIIPIYFNNKLVSYQGRSIFSKSYCDKNNILRYKNLSKKDSVIDPKTILYNIDNCKNKFVIVTEGVFDVWRWGNNCVGSFGTSMTDNQLNFLAYSFDKIFFIFDPEKEAQKRAEQYANIVLGRIQSLEKKSEVLVINTELPNDLGASTKKEIIKIKKELGIL